MLLFESFKSGFPKLGSVMTVQGVRDDVSKFVKHSACGQGMQVMLCMTNEFVRYDLYFSTE